MDYFNFRKAQAVLVSRDTWTYQSWTVHVFFFFFSSLRTARSTSLSGVWNWSVWTLTVLTRFVPPPSPNWWLISCGSTSTPPHASLPHMWSMWPPTTSSQWAGVRATATSCDHHAGPGCMAGHCAKEWLLSNQSKCVCLCVVGVCMVYWLCLYAYV